MTDHFKDKTSNQTPGTKFNLHQMFEEIELWQKSVNIKDSGSFSAESDISVESWIKQKQFTPFAADYLRAFVRGIICHEPEEVGIHYALNYIKSGGGFNSLFLEGPEGAQALKIKQGEANFHC